MCQTPEAARAKVRDRTDEGEPARGDSGRLAGGGIIGRESEPETGIDGRQGQTASRAGRRVEVTAVEARKKLARLLESRGDELMALMADKKLVGGNGSGT